MKTVFFFIVLGFNFLYSQSISDFISVIPGNQTQQFIIPDSHRFQKIIEVGDPLTGGGVMPIRPDFSGYVPISNSSTEGYLSINSENSPGGNTQIELMLYLI